MGAMADTRRFSANTREDLALGFDDIWGYAAWAFAFFVLTILQLFSWFIFDLIGQRQWAWAWMVFLPSAWSMAAGDLLIMYLVTDLEWKHEPKIWSMIPVAVVRETVVNGVDTLIGANTLLALVLYAPLSIYQMVVYARWLGLKFRVKKKRIFAASLFLLFCVGGFLFSVGEPSLQPFFKALFPVMPTVAFVLEKLFSKAAVFLLSVEDDPGAAIPFMGALHCITESARLFGFAYLCLKTFRGAPVSALIINISLGIFMEVMAHSGQIQRFWDFCKGLCGKGPRSLKQRAFDTAESAVKSLLEYSVVSILLVFGPILTALRARDCTWCSETYIRNTRPPQYGGDEINYHSHGFLIFALFLLGELLSEAGTVFVTGKLQKRRPSLQKSLSHTPCFWLAMFQAWNLSNIVFFGLMYSVG